MGPMQNKSVDVFILGAGIVGLSLALKLQEQGRHVILVDRGAPGAATCPSGGVICIDIAPALPVLWPAPFWRGAQKYPG